MKNIANFGKCHFSSQKQSFSKSNPVISWGASVLGWLQEVKLYLKCQSKYKHTGMCALPLHTMIGYVSQSVIGQFAAIKNILWLHFEKTVSFSLQSASRYEIKQHKECFGQCVIVNFGILWSQKSCSIFPCKYCYKSRSL